MDLSLRYFLQSFISTYFMKSQVLRPRLSYISMVYRVIDHFTSVTHACCANENTWLFIIMPTHGLIG